jgi:glycosyltransferase involved in cell wall biosynthesis
MTRLLNVNSYHYRRGGSDVVYLDHAEMMAAAGFETAFFSMHHPKNLPTPWSEHFVDELEFGHDYPLWQRVGMAGKVVYSVEARRKLARLLDRFPADVAHLHCIYHHLSPSILPLLRERGVPVVMTAHDLKIACPAYKMLNAGGICERCNGGSVLNVLRHRCIRGSAAASAVVAVESGLHRWLRTYQRHLSAVVVPSRFFLRKFVEWGWPEQAFEYIPNYVDAGRFEPLFEPGDHLLYFGRLAPEKGLHTLVRAAAQARVPVALAGTGPEEPALRELVARLDAPVRFLGFRAGGELHDSIRAARAVVLPSEWYENAPMSVLEAMALGRTVVGARIGGIPELVQEGQTGWLFDSGNVAGLADRMRQVMTLADGTLRDMGGWARRHVEQTFHAAGYREAMLALYRRLGVTLPAPGWVAP